MKTEDIAILGSLAVGAYYVLGQSSTAYAAPITATPYYKPFVPSGGVTSPDITGTVIRDIGGVIQDVSCDPSTQDCSGSTQILQKAGGALATIGIAAVKAGAVIGHALVALATNPITWAVAGAAGIGYLWYRSQAHHQADEWVQGFQNPFDQTMAGIDNRIEAGQIDGEQAQILRKAAVTDYIEAMHNFAAQGDNQALVIRQATDTFTYYYGQDPDSYLAEVKADLAALGYA